MLWYQVLQIVLAVLAVLLVLYIVGANIVAYGVRKKIIKPKKRSLETSRGQQIKETGLDFDQLEKEWDRHPFTVKTADGLTLNGIYILNSTESKPAKVAIIVHGHTANYMHSYKYATIFVKSGYNVVMYNSRYFGDSEGEFDTLGQRESEDLSLVIDFTRSQFGQDCYIALHGESMGAATVLLETAVRSDIAMVVADCPFSNSEKLYYDLMKKKTPYPVSFLCRLTSLYGRKYGYDLYKVNPIDAVKKTDIPILLIHGQADDFIPPYHSRSMAAVLRNPESKLVEFPAARHACSFYTDSARYTEVVSQFVKRIEQLSYKGE